MLPPLNIAKGRGAWCSNLTHRCEFANTCPLEQAPASWNSTSFLTCSLGAAILRRRCPRTLFCQSLDRRLHPARTPRAFLPPRLFQSPHIPWNSITMRCFGYTVHNTGGRDGPASKSSLAQSSRRTPVGPMSSAPFTICANRSSFPPPPWLASLLPVSPA